MREISVTIDGVRSPLLEFGSRDVSEAVVFVHGNPGIEQCLQATRDARTQVIVPSDAISDYKLNL
jgi:hypothetical protein